MDVGMTPPGRERVLQRARTLFLDRGYSDVSMQQIANASGMTKAALYYHFRDKEDLFAQVVLQEMRAQRASIEREIAAGGTLALQVDRLVRLYFDQTTPDVLRMMNDFREHVPESRHDDVHQELHHFVDAISAIFERTAEAGEMRDIPPRIAAFVFFHTVRALLTAGFYDPDLVLPDTDSAVRLISELVLHGIAAPADAALEPDAAPLRR